MNNSAEWLNRLQSPEWKTQYENQRDFAELSEALGIASWSFPGNLDTVDLKTSPKDLLGQMEAITFRDQVNFIKQFETGIGAQFQWDTVLQVAHQSGATAAIRRWGGAMATLNSPKDFSKVFKAVSETFFCSGNRFPTLNIETDTKESVRFGLNLMNPKIDPSSILMIYSLWLHWHKGYVHSLDARITMKFSPDSHQFWVEWK